MYTMLQENSLADKMFIYRFSDSGDVRGARENSFGLVNSTDNTAKPSYVMISAMNYILSDAVFKEKTVLNNDVYAYTFEDRNGKAVTVCWSVCGDASVTVKADNPIDVYDVYGNKVSEEKESVSIEVTKAPVYIYGENICLRRNY